MYENITAEGIKKEILEDLTLWSKDVGSYAYTLIAPVSYQLWVYYTQLEAMVTMVFPDENSGPWIDRHANMYGIERKEGEKAECEITFTGTSGTKVPAGKVFLTEDGLKFLLKSETTIPGTGILVAESVGMVYNVNENEIKIQQSPLNGLTSWTTTEALGGVDPETDASLVSRYYDRLRMPATSGNVYHYQQWAREVPGVGAVKVYPLWDGPGTVKLVLAGDGYTVPDEEIVQAAKDYIETVRPIGADVTVEAATALTVSISVSVEKLTGADLEAIKEEFTAKVAEYFKTISFNVRSEVVLTTIGRLLSECEGVYDYTSLLLNGWSENVIVSETDIPVLGEVDLNETL